MRYYLKEISDELFEYWPNEVSDILETLIDFDCLNAKWKSLYKYHHAKYYKSLAKPWERIMDRVKKHWKTLSVKKKKRCLENRDEVENRTVRKFLEDMYHKD